MGIVYSLDKYKGITFVLWRGHVTAYDFLDHIKRLTSDPFWPLARHMHIADLRNADVDKSIDEATMREGADYYGEYLHRIATLKAAIITTKELERARFFAQFVSHYGPVVKVFETMEEAIKWLSIDPKDVELAFIQLRAEP